MANNWKLGKNSAFVTVGLVLVVFLSCKLANQPSNAMLAGNGINVTKIVKKGEAKLVYADISLFAGELSVSGNSKELMKAEFTYENEEFTPELDYDESTEIGNLSLNLNKGDIDFDFNWDDSEENDVDIKWDVFLNNDVPMDLNIKFGAGKGDFDLSGLNLQGLELAVGAGEFNINLRNSSIPRIDFKAGAGEAVVDLSGKREKNLDGEFLCGVGNLTVLLPKDIGVKIIANGLIGTISYSGLQKDDNEYINDVFGNTKNHISLKIVGGIGDIDLKVVD